MKACYKKKKLRCSEKPTQVLQAVEWLHLLKEQRWFPQLPPDFWGEKKKAEENWWIYDPGVQLQPTKGIQLFIYTSEYNETEQ